MSGKSSQFSITKCEITADRFGGFEEKFFDVKTSVIELNIFESLDKPYLTGNISTSSPLVFSKWCTELYWSSSFVVESVLIVPSASV